MSFPIKNGDFPVRYVSLPEGMCFRRLLAKWVIEVRVHPIFVPWPHARHVFSRTFYCGFSLVVHRLFIHQLKHVKTTKSLKKISPKNPWKTPGIYGNMETSETPRSAISGPRWNHRFHSYSAGRTVPLEPPPVDPSTSAPLRPPARSRLCHPGAKLEGFWHP